MDSDVMYTNLFYVFFCAWRNSAGKILQTDVIISPLKHLHPPWSENWPHKDKISKIVAM